MTFERKPLSKMNQESVDYLRQNTPLTYLEDGGIGVSMVKAMNRQVFDLQNYMSAAMANSRLSTASGIFLDMIGELLSVKRLTSSAATVSRADNNIKFYVQSGNLGQHFPHPNESTKGLIPAGTRIFNSDQSITFSVNEDVVFPRGLKEVYVGAVAGAVGSNQQVGAGQLTRHSLSSAVLVTNLQPVNNGRSYEDDETYRFRISNAVLTLAGANRSAIETAALSFPSVQRVEIREFARGSGTFDVLVVPVNSKLSQSVKRDIENAILRNKAVGISFKIVEPVYVSVCISIQLIFSNTVLESEQEAIKIRAKNNVKAYFESLSIGGEIIINQIRSAVMTSGPGKIKDMRIIDLCFNGRPMIRRNIQLGSNELLILDNSRSEAIQII